MRAMIAAAIISGRQGNGRGSRIDDLRSCQARICRPPEFPWRGRTLQLAGGLTAAPTMIRVLEQMAEVPPVPNRTPLGTSRSGEP